MKRIIIHWTGGAYFPCETDLSAYHFLIDKNGKIYKGIYKPEDNENCSDGKYAKHCGGGNTGAIGVALCAMAGFDLKNKKTPYPITEEQLISLFELLSELAQKYKIDKNFIMTHYEFGRKNPKTSSYGKIDITYLPPFSKLKPEQTGDFIRSKISFK